MALGGRWLAMSAALLAAVAALAPWMPGGAVAATEQTSYPWCNEEPRYAQFQDCPQPVRDVQAAGANDMVTVTWKPPENPDAICRGGDIGWGQWAGCTILGYEVRASWDAATQTGYGKCIAEDLVSPGCSISGLAPGVTYSFSVYSVYAAGPHVPLGQHPNVGVTDPPPHQIRRWGPFATVSGMLCCSLPQPVAAVTASATGNALDVIWQAPTDWGGASELTYTVTTVPPSGECVVAVLACRLERLDYGTAYRVLVSASNSAGAAAPAASATTYEIAPTPPTPPSTVSARYPAMGTARVTWSPATSDGGRTITRYTATARPGGRTCTAQGSGRSCLITGLAGSSAYAFTVSATNAMGTSAPSPAGVAGVLVNPASAPRAVRAVASGSGVRVSWTGPVNDRGGRLVQYVARAGGRTCTTRQLSCSIGGLALGRLYSVSVTAVTTGGRSRPGTAEAYLPAPTALPPSPKPVQAVF